MVTRTTSWEAGTAIPCGCCPTSIRPIGLLVATSTTVTSLPALLVTYSFCRTLADSPARIETGRHTRTTRESQRLFTAHTPGGMGKGLFVARVMVGSLMHFG